MKLSAAMYRQEAAQELAAILGYWMQHTVDQEQGGFYGRLDERDRVHATAPKGIVLNSRILWAFSAAHRATKQAAYLAMAERACRYITEHFIDPDYGGVYWSVDYLGNRLNDRKQVYGLAFCIYGLSEYYKVSADANALNLSIELFRLIEQYSYDAERKGYYEAFSRDWKMPHDLRLSEKDANEKKTMNTHLHVVEAYANLFTIWPDAYLKTQIERLLEVFVTHIIEAETGHLVLFFDEQWQRRSNMVSYGHDIEAAWLLQRVAETIGEEKWISMMKQKALQVTRAAMEGLDADGGLWYEYENGQLVRQKHSWPQAEAMIGFLNAWQVSGDEQYFSLSQHSWQFVKAHIKDWQHGEWFWGINGDYSLMAGQDKAGFWKCPYHNSRAMLELMKRLANHEQGTENIE